MPLSAKSSYPFSLARDILDGSKDNHDDTMAIYMYDCGKKMANHVRIILKW